MFSLFLITLLINFLPFRLQEIPATSRCPAEALETFRLDEQAVLTASMPLYDSPTPNTFIDMLQLGEIVTILDEPLCDEFSVYWHVESERVSGWVSDSYFIRSTGDTPTYIPFGVIVPYVETDGFTRLLPSDINVGLGFSTGGAGGGFLSDEACLMNYFQSDEPLPTTPIFAFYYSCESAQADKVFFNSGEQITLTDAELSVTWWELDHVPTICYADANANAIAISPSGEQQAVNTNPRFLCQVNEYQTAMLPEEAYSIPGLWTLQVGDFQLFIEIPVADAPIFSAFDDENDGYTLWLGGFESEERIILFVGSPFSGSGASATIQYFEVVADENGYFRGAINTIGSIYVAVGEFENIHWKGRCEGEFVDYENRDESCAARLYAVFWGDRVDSTK